MNTCLRFELTSSPDLSTNEMRAATSLKENQS
jgi:hypothetical protein